MKHVNTATSTLSSLFDFSRPKSLSPDLKPRCVFAMSRCVLEVRVIHMKSDFRLSCVVMIQGNLPLLLSDVCVCVFV